MRCLLQVSQMCVDIGNLPEHLKVSFLIDLGCPNWETVSPLGPELELCVCVCLFLVNLESHKHDESTMWMRLSLRTSQREACYCTRNQIFTKSVNVEKPTPGSLGFIRDCSLPTASRSC